MCCMEKYCLRFKPGFYCFKKEVRTGDLLIASAARDQIVHVARRTRTKIVCFNDVEKRALHRLVNSRPTESEARELESSFATLTKNGEDFRRSRFVV